MTRTEELRRRGAVDRQDMTGEDARELLRASLGSDPWERLESLREAGERKAKAEGVAYQLDHQRKQILAKIATEIASAHAKSNLSEAKLDRLARADDRYLRHLEGTAAAIEAKERAQSEYWAIRAGLEWDRAAIAHLNALTRLDEPA